MPRMAWNTIDLDIDKIIEVFNKTNRSIVKTSKQFGFGISGVYLCCVGKRKVHKGYTWKYKE